jgi:nucleotide-binding universal stress UspA family protein
MKTILAPVDFSDASTNALSFAAELSKRASARLIIMHVQADHEDEEGTRNKLESVLSDLKKTFGPDLNGESLVVQGSFIAALKEVTETQRPNLIVMGTKGASGLKRILIGSNTVNVIANTKLPVLVIPEVARFEDFNRMGKNRIILATDLDAMENEDPLDIMKEIALFIVDPKIRVLSVRPKNTDLDYLKRLERDALLSAFRPEIETERVTVFSSNVIRGINFYLNEHDDTGLIAMIARDSGGLIQKHFTREMASHTHLPLLVMHDAKILS